MKRGLEECAAALFDVYENRSLQGEISEAIQKLPDGDQVKLSWDLHDLIKPVVDRSSGQEWTMEMRQPALRFYNLIVESRWEHGEGDPPPGEIANYSRVSSRIFRGSQPTAEGFGWLVDHGIRSVVTLRQEDPLDLDLMEWRQVKHFVIPIQDRGVPTLAQVEEFIRTVDDPVNGPVYVHCRGGIERTGVMVACWRIAHGWTAIQSISEARSFALLGDLPENQEEFIRNFEAYLRSRFLPA